ncbi:MAG: hypothetical protein IPI73_00340 [Betaproteobacteria bacterium]|nr:hypothetical protein [Betaproteobacteria bacterium]
MQDNRVALQNAVRCWESLNAGNPCFSGGNPASGIYVPPNFIVSLFCSLFQDEKPNQREVYRGQGAAEAYDQLLTRNGAVELTAVLDDLDWFAARAVTDSGPLFAPDSQAEKDYQGALNVFRFIRGKEKVGFLLSLINPSAAPDFVIRALLVLGTTVWDLVDFAVIGNDLHAAAAAAETADPGLEAMLDGPLTEVALVFMGSVLVPATPPAGIPQSRPCGFHAGYQCSYWAIRETIRTTSPSVMPGLHPRRAWIPGRISR